MAEDEKPVVIPDTPPRVPTGLPKPASASEWRTADDPAHAELTVSEGSQFSSQSQQAINALEESLENPEVTQIDGYGPGKFSVQFQGQHRLLSDIKFSSTEEYLLWLRQTVDNSPGVTTWIKIKEECGGTVNTPSGGRLTISLPPMAVGAPTFSLRKHIVAKWTATDFVESGTLSKTMMDFLRVCVAARINILFVGQIGAGKTTLLRALASGFSEDEKVAVVEQVSELNINKPLVAQYIYQPGVEGLDLESVLDLQLYNGVDRIIVGEVHLAGITKMLETMIVTEGSMSTYHAFSSEQAGERMKLALQIENQNVTSLTALSFIKQAIELVVVLERVEGKRVVAQITELDWRSSGGGEILGGRDLFVYDRKEKVFKTGGSPPDENGRVMFKCSKYRVPIQPSWFIDQDQLARLQAISRDER